MQGRLLIVLVVLLMSSCQITKKQVKKPYVRPNRFAIKERYGINTVDTVFKPQDSKWINKIKKNNVIAGIIPLWERDIEYTTFSGKAKMHYSAGGDKQDFTAHIRIEKDKRIWISISAGPGGVVNVARLLITPDSIILVNHLQKDVHRLNIKDANKLMPAPVDFNTMQNFIIGNILSKTGSPSDATDFGGTWSMEVLGPDITQQVAFNKTDSSMRTLQLHTKDDMVKGMIQYSSYQMKDNRKFSTGRVITISNAGEPYYLDMDFNKAEFDKALDFPFSIPKNYTVK